MAHMIRHGQKALFPWLLGFAAGIFLMGMCMEMTPGMVRAAQGEPLPTVIYNDRGQKVCVRQDTALELEKTLRIDLPLGTWGSGEIGRLEMRLYFEDGTILAGCLHIKKKAVPE